MATIKWKSGTNGDFNTIGNWTPGQIPSAADDAQIEAAGTYTVTSSVNNTVNTLEMQASATLTVTGSSTFAINDGSGAGALAGTISVADGATLALGGVVDNTGAINLGSAGSTTDLVISSPMVTLEGGGKINLSNNASNRLFGASGAYVLDNVDNIIAGAGNVGIGQLTLINSGQIVANQTLALVLNTGNFVQNTGILKSSNTAAGSGGLVIDNTNVDNSGNANSGKIEAIGANTHVDLEGATITGGTLMTSGGGVIQTISSGTLDGVSQGVAVNISGTVMVDDNTTLTLDGVIDNKGTIRVASTVDTTNLVIGSQTVTLEGGGALTLSNSSANRIYGNSGTNQLINVDNIISGAGQLGLGQTALTNETKGVINANQKTALTLNGGGVVIANSGLIEATNTGGLLVQSTIDNAGGTIKAAGTGAHVDLGGAYIEGGTLTTATNGKIQTVGGSGTLDGLTAGTLTIAGTVTVTDQTSLTLVGTINNTGTIALSAISTSGSTDLRLNSQIVTLQGHGKITLSNNVNNRIYANNGSDQLVNVNNTISGAGQFGIGQTIIINQTAGIIDANQKTALTVNGGYVLTNAGLMEDTGKGGLVINNTIDNAGGTIEATGAGAHVDLSGGYIEGGTLKTASGGVIKTAGGSNGNLDGLTAGVLTNAGTTSVTDNTSLTLEGVINNTGTIALASSVDTTDLRINSQTVTLEGGGHLTLSNSGNNRIYANNGSDRLVNVNNTISGAGLFGIGQTMIVNETAGVIDANQKTALTVNGGYLLTNAGLMEDTGTGGLVLNSTIDNVGGTIAALGAGTLVDLAGAYIEGGSLKAANGGVIQTGTNNGNLDGVTAGKVLLTGTLNVTDSTVLTLEGVIDNTGTINLASVGNTTDIRLNGETVTFDGGGKVILSNFSGNRIFGNSGLFTLDNVDNTISGSGQFGIGQMQFSNGGTINSVGSVGMTISLGSGQGLNTAAGKIEATGTGGLTFTSGFIINNGQITALDGSFVTFNGATLENNTQNTLTGGQWAALATGHGATISLTGGTVIDDAASIVLSGAGSVFQSGSGSTFTTLEQTLTTIASTGNLSVLNNRGYTTALSLSVAGSLQLGGGTFKAHSIAIGTTGIAFGLGTIADAIANNGSIISKTGTLDVTGAISGSGSLAAEETSTLKLDGAVAAGQTATLAAAGSKLILTDGSAFAATIKGFGSAASQSIDLTTVAFANVKPLTFTSTADTLKVTDGTHTVTLHLFGQYVAAGFHDSKDASGGTMLTYTAPSGGNEPQLAAHH